MNTYILVYSKRGEGAGGGVNRSMANDYSHSWLTNCPYGIIVSFIMAEYEIRLVFALVFSMEKRLNSY